MPKKRIQYTYDAAGNRRTMVDPDGGRFTYAYDGLHRIAHLVNPQNERTTYAYDAAGRRTVKKLANGTRASFTYDVANNLTRLANLKSDGTTISSFDYAYDNTGNRTAVLEADGSRVTWSYDTTYQLTGEHRTGTTPYRNTFTYDPAGNRTLKNESGARTTYTYDAANQLATSLDATGTTTFTFDANGNQQLVRQPTGARTTTSWDYENRTTLVKLPSGVRNTMAYDPDGLRVKLDESTGTKKFVWDDQNYLAETDASNVTQVLYTNEPAQYGNLISQRRASTTHWFHFDAIGSTRQLTTVVQAVSDTYLYDAWGILLAQSGATPGLFRWIGAYGYVLDVDTANEYVGDRIYRPQLAQWMSIDPDALSQSASLLYVYSHNRPIIFVDPKGRSTTLLLSPQTAKGMPYCSTVQQAPPGMANDLGLTDPIAYDVSCVCNCCPHEKPKMNVECTIRMWLKIYINVKAAIDYGKKVKKDGLAGVYGHEQRHVANHIQGAKDAAAMIDKRLADNKCWDCRLCNIVAKKLVEDAQKLLDAVRKREGDHSPPAPSKSGLYPPFNKPPIYDCSPPGKKPDFPKGKPC
ncbi:MAG: RHS repeat domain-containing protein [Thermomicrobiales bacterium]